MPDQKEQSNQSLTDKITELEALLARNKSSQKSVPVLEELAGTDDDNGGEIPILDELVDADDTVDVQHHAELPSATADQLIDLINNIEHRLTDELETLVKTLKNTMKESIIDELKTRLETPGDSITEPEERPDFKTLHQENREF